MSIEHGSDYYDEYYSSGKTKYFNHYSESEYYEMWKRILPLIPDREINIFEVGCGTGQFARMLLDNRKQIIYSGIDFSQVAINEAIKNIPEWYYNVKCMSAYDAVIKDDCIIICLETLEHINDFRLINNLPLGTEIIFTVPDFAYASHVRYFKNITEIVFRYYQKINIDYIEKFNHWFICKGTTI